LCDSRPSHHVTVAVPAAVVAVTQACTRSRFSTNQRIRAPPHERSLGEGHAFGLIRRYNEAVDPLSALPRLLPCGCLSARARRVKAEPLGFLACSRCSPRARLGTPPAETPLLLLSAAVNTNPSSAWSIRRARPGKGEKVPAFGTLWPRPFHPCMRRASGRPHALTPAQTPPPHHRPPRVEPARRAASTSCADTRPNFIPLPCFGCVLNPVGPCKGMARVTAVEPHRRRAAADTLPLWGFSSSTWQAAPKPRGFWVSSCGHTCSWPQKIPVDPVRPAT
jgi:hypothetical protein